jgi:hypothetical protein
MTNYTLKQCKEDMLLIWGYLKDHPEVTSKEAAIRQIPSITSFETKRLSTLYAKCPCCQYSARNTDYPSCDGECPIWGTKSYKCNNTTKSEFTIWHHAKNSSQRKNAATKIYNMSLDIRV